MLLEQEFNTLATRYSFDLNEYDIGAFIWAKAEHAMLDNCMVCTLEETLECGDCSGEYESGDDLPVPRKQFSTEEIQKYYTGFSYLPKDKVQAKITASEAQFLSSLLKQALNALEEVKKYDKHKAEVIWQMCDGTLDTVDYYIELKQHLNRKDKTKKQANKLAAIQKKLKVIASS